MQNIDQVNTSIYNATKHLMEASKYLSDTGFKDESKNLMVLAGELSLVIELTPDKISEDKMTSIMDEILNYGN